MIKCEFTNSAEAMELKLYDYVGQYDAVNTEVVSDALDNAEGKPLNIYINSYGGEVFEGFAIYNILKRYNGFKTVYIDGISASIASIIALSGDKVIMHEASMFMIHNASGGVWGTSEDMKKVANSLDQINEVLKNIYEEKSNLTREQITDFMNEEKFFTAQECLEYGLCDEILNEKIDEEKTEVALNLLKESIEQRINTLNSLRAVDTSVFKDEKVEEPVQEIVESVPHTNTLKAFIRDFTEGK